MTLAQITEWLPQIIKVFWFIMALFVIMLAKRIYAQIKNTQIKNKEKEFSLEDQSLRMEIDTLDMDDLRKRVESELRKGSDSSDPSKK